MLRLCVVQRQTNLAVTHHHSEELSPVSPIATSITYNFHYHLPTFGHPTVATGHIQGVIGTTADDIRSRPTAPARLDLVPPTSDMLLQPQPPQPQTISPPQSAAPQADTLPGRKLTSRASTWPAGNGEVVTD
jgi:hypothetical protein